MGFIFKLEKMKNCVIKIKTKDFRVLHFSFNVDDLPDLTWVHINDKGNGDDNTNPIRIIAGPDTLTDHHSPQNAPAASAAADDDDDVCTTTSPLPSPFQHPPPPSHRSRITNAGAGGGSSIDNSRSSRSTLGKTFFRFVEKYASVDGIKKVAESKVLFPLPLEQLFVLFTRAIFPSVVTSLDMALSNRSVITYSLITLSSLCASPCCLTHGCFTHHSCV